MDDRRAMPLAARRVFRMASATALSLAVAYGLGMPLAFMAPLLALMLTSLPAPPPGPKGLAGLLLVVFLTLGVGLVMTPILLYYPVTGLLVAGLGIYFSNHVTVIGRKMLVGVLLTIGFTMIPAAGTVHAGLAVAVITSVAAGMAIAVVAQWIVYPWFPEDSPKGRAPAVAQDAASSNWIALRATLVVMPPFFLCLTNPTMYMPVVLKSAVLGQQASMVGARVAGRELLGSTFLAGIFAIMFWFALKLSPNLWMFSLWMLVFGVYFAAKLFGVLRSRFSASFWQSVAITTLILIGPAVQDSANGKDVYAAFAVRMGLFIAVTLYAWGAVVALERLRARRTARTRSLRLAEVR